MTMSDLGPERPSQAASQTREWGERGRTDGEPQVVVSTRRFLILLVLIVAALVVFFALR